MGSFVKVNVLTRLIIGFSALFVITTSVSVYSILKLKHFNRASVQMLQAGDRMLGYKDQLSDSLLSEITYEKKFVITKDNMFYDRFVEAGKEFALSLRGAADITDTFGSKELLDSIARGHACYVALVGEERSYIRSGKPYRFDRYKAEKETVVDAMIKDIKKARIVCSVQHQNGNRGIGQVGDRSFEDGTDHGIAFAFSWRCHCWGHYPQHYKTLICYKEKDQGDRPRRI